MSDDSPHLRESQREIRRLTIAGDFSSFAYLISSFVRSAIAEFREDAGGWWTCSFVCKSDIFSKFESKLLANIISANNSQI